MDNTKINYYMNIALSLANKAKAKGEVPVGCVIVKDEKVVATGYNKREKNKNALMHAEIIAINKACKKLKNWRLIDCEIFVNLEPCVMCYGAIYNSRIQKLYYGIKNKTNTINFDEYIQNNQSIMNHKLKTESGIMQKECEEMFKKFFRK